MKSIEEVASTWPPIFDRDFIERETGGVINKRSLANQESRGEGPPGKFYWGRKVGYHREPFIEWLKQRTRV